MNAEAQEVDAEIVRLSDRAAKLRETFATPGWQEIIFPGTQAIRALYADGLIRGRMEDAAQNGRVIPDDELRAVIKTCGWILSWEGDLETTQTALAQAIVAVGKTRGEGVDPAPESASGSPLVSQDI